MCINLSLTYISCKSLMSKIKTIHYILCYVFFTLKFALFNNQWQYYRAENTSSIPRCEIFSCDLIGILKRMLQNSDQVTAKYSIQVSYCVLLNTLIKKIKNNSLIGKCNINNRYVEIFYFCKYFYSRLAQLKCVITYLREKTPIVFENYVWQL